MGGHPWPLRITADRVEEVGEPGPLLGGFSDVSWRDLTLELEPGSALMLYTDGITDARDGKGERFGLSRLRGTLEQLRSRPAEEILQGVTRKLDEFQSASHADDIAAIALRRIP
jgi:phosphoserine phosphatase RsbU/P